ncbi:hypothetical protein [Singulisphaera sp. PoT]|uniref:hypothetical protein n=1 Tax=Singulisphaera sp. PoT TaxID=3411797 RepID=UPI003BF4CE6A
MPTSTEALARRVAVALIALLSVAGCGEESDGLEKYPVRGSVLVNGKPAEMMAVTFHNSDANAPGNASRPVAVTDAEGRFTLSTNADKDGAIPGEYLVTFFWSSENGPSAYDRLGGRFQNPKASTFKVQVGRKENDLEPFKLDVDSKAPKPARKIQALPQ